MEDGGDNQIIMKSDDEKDKIRDQDSRCDRCGGCGMVSDTPVRCSSCVELHIYGCMRCKSGYIVHPYEICLACDGSGTQRNV